MILLAILFGALLCATTTQTHATQELKCDLTWVSSANGAYPENAVAYSLDDVIIRVNQDSQFYVGRMTPETRIANVIVQNTTIIHPTEYEVLVNSKNCITEWVSSSIANDTRNAVTVETTFIGRTAVISSDKIYIVGGGVTLNSIAVNYEDEMFYENDFEILVSKYPLQQIILNDFSFEATGNQTSIKRELIFQQFQQSSGNFGVNPIKFQTSIWENIELHEDKNWIGIGNPISYSMTWPYSPMFAGTFEMVSEYNSSVSIGFIARDRTILSEIPNVFASYPDIVCAYANYNTGQINFKAKALFQKEDFTEDFLRDSNRTIKFMGETKIFSEISGFISGKLYTGTTIISCTNCQTTCEKLIGSF